MCLLRRGTCCFHSHFICQNKSCGQAWDQDIMLVNVPAGRADYILYENLTNPKKCWCGLNCVLSKTYAGIPSSNVTLFEKPLGRLSSSSEVIRVGPNPIHRFPLKKKKGRLGQRDTHVQERTAFKGMGIPIPTGN